MKELQELNTQKDSASDPMIMFLCINASGLTLIPVSIMTYRAQMGAANPADVFLPLMLATFSSTGRILAVVLQANGSTVLQLAERMICCPELSVWKFLLLFPPKVSAAFLWNRELSNVRSPASSIPCA